MKNSLIVLLILSSLIFSGCSQQKGLSQDEMFEKKHLQQLIGIFEPLGGLDDLVGYDQENENPSKFMIFSGGDFYEEFVFMKKNSLIDRQIIDALQKERYLVAKISIDSNYRVYTLDKISMGSISGFNTIDYTSRGTSFSEVINGEQWYFGRRKLIDMHKSYSDSQDKEYRADFIKYGRPFDKRIILDEYVNPEFYNLVQKFSGDSQYHWIQYQLVDQNVLDAIKNKKTEIGTGEGKEIKELLNLIDGQESGILRVINAKIPDAYHVD